MLSLPSFLSGRFVLATCTFTLYKFKWHCVGEISVSQVSWGNYDEKFVFKTWEYCYTSEGWLLLVSYFVRWHFSNFSSLPISEIEKSLNLISLGVESTAYSMEIGQTRERKLGETTWAKQTRVTRRLKPWVNAHWLHRRVEKRRRKVKRRVQQRR